MKTNLLATTALITFMASAAFAQEATPAPESNAPTGIFSTDPNTKPLTSTDGYFTASAGQLLASAFIGKAVYNGPGEDAKSVGNVSDIILGSNGTAEAVVIGVGGFLGIGQKDVAVDFDQLSSVRKEDGTSWLVIDATKEELEAAPAFDRSANFTDGVADPQKAAAEAAKTDATATPAPAAPAATATAEKSARDGLTGLEVTALKSDNLMGATVYAANDDNIGSVSDALMTADGQIEAFVIDVGGFLGIGKKPVAVSIENLDFMADSNGKVTVFTQFTKEQLEAGAEYSEEAYSANREKLILRGVAE